MVIMSVSMAKQRLPCSISDAELLRYEDGDLPAERHAALDEHVASCCACQERLAASVEIGRLLRPIRQQDTNPAGEARLLAHLRQHQPQPQQLPIGRRLTSSPLSIVACLLMILLVGITLQETTTATFNLGRVIAFVSPDEPRRQPASETPAGLPLTVSPMATAPASGRSPTFPSELPEGFALVEPLDVTSERTIAHYTGPGGRQLRIVQERTRPGMTSLGGERSELLIVQRTEVVVEYNSVGDIARVIWADSEALFDLLVLASGNRLITVDDVVAIVDALLTAQRPHS